MVDFVSTVILDVRILCYIAPFATLE